MSTALKFYEDDLGTPNIADVELVRWRNKWSKVEKASVSNSASDALGECNDASFSSLLAESPFPC